MKSRSRLIPKPEQIVLPMGGFMGSCWPPTWEMCGASSHQFPLNVTTVTSPVQDPEFLCQYPSKLNGNSGFFHQYFSKPTWNPKFLHQQPMKTHLGPRVSPSISLESQCPPSVSHLAPLESRVPPQLRVWAPILTPTPSPHWFLLPTSLQLTERPFIREERDPLPKAPWDERGSAFPQAGIPTGSPGPIPWSAGAAGAARFSWRILYG